MVMETRDSRIGAQLTKIRHVVLDNVTSDMLAMISSAVDPGAIADVRTRTERKRSDRKEGNRAMNERNVDASGKLHTRRDRVSTCVPPSIGLSTHDVVLADSTFVSDTLLSSGSRARSCGISGES
jgi:hypothetical protein